MSDGFDTASTVLRRALVGGGVVTLSIGVVAGGIGLAVAGVGGLVSGLVGAVFALVFLGVTAAGLLFTGPLLGGDSPVTAMVVLLGGFVIKVALFVVAVLLLRGQPWVQPTVLFLSLVVAVLAFLVLDAVVVARARIPVGAPER